MPRAAVALPGLDPEHEWQAALCVRLPAETIEFGAAADAAAALIAVKGLPDLLERRVRPGGPVGAVRVPGGGQIIEMTILPLVAPWAMWLRACGVAEKGKTRSTTGRMFPFSTRVVISLSCLPLARMNRNE